MGTFMVDVICENEKCKNFRLTVNRISANEPKRKAVELLLDEWGQGSEEEADFCKACGQLGVAYPHGEAPRYDSFLAGKR